MIGRWMGLREAAEYMGCSVTTVKRHIDEGILNWSHTLIGFKRLDREQIDAMFIMPARGLPRNRGVVTEEDERRFVRRKPPKGATTCAPVACQKR